jgi:hypothetical protein
MRPDIGPGSLSEILSAFHGWDRRAAGAAS